MSTSTFAARTATGLPGLAIGTRPAAPRPDRLLGSGTLLLAGGVPGQRVALAQHRARWGEQPVLSLAELAERARRVDLRGAGGAAFPTDRKLTSLAGRRVGTVVVNASEGEMTSAKDGILLQHVPHLVLDGAVSAARALGAARVVVRVAADRAHAVYAVTQAIAERRDAGISFDVSVGPDTFVSGEATAVIRSLTGGPSAPAQLGLPPRAPRRGLRPRPHVFLSNTETLARLAVASRDDRRRSALVTVSGAVAHAGVMELPDDLTLGHVAATVGLVGTPRMLITGGWHGAWLRWPDVADAVVSRDGLARAGGRWGAGALVWLPADIDPRRALTAVVNELAAASAGQCGPCVSGLPELAAALRRAERSPAMTAEVARLVDTVDGRGLCAHPTATAAAVRSAWAAISDVPGRSSR